MNWIYILLSIILLILIVIIIRQQQNIKKLKRMVSYFLVKEMISKGMIKEDYGFFDPISDAFNYLKDKLGGAFNSAIDAISSAANYLFNQIGAGADFLTKNLSKVASAVADYSTEAAKWAARQVSNAARHGLDIIVDVSQFATTQIGVAAQFLRERATDLGISEEDMAIILCGQITSGAKSNEICKSIAKSAGAKKGESVLIPSYPTPDPNPVDPSKI